MTFTPEKYFFCKEENIKKQKPNLNLDSAFYIDKVSNLKPET